MKTTDRVGYQQHSTFYISFTYCPLSVLFVKTKHCKVYRQLAGQYKASQSSLLGESEGVVASQIQNMRGFGAFLGSGPA